MSWLMVFVGGGIGSILRYFLSQKFYESHNFPIATFIANIIACFCLGYLMKKYEFQAISEDSKLVFATGFCGGLSTFSTLIFEIYTIYTQSNYTSMWIYLFASIIGGLLCLYCGLKIAEII